MYELWIYSNDLKTMKIAYKSMIFLQYFLSSHKKHQSISDPIALELIQKLMSLGL